MREQVLQVYKTMYRITGDHHHHLEKILDWMVAGISQILSAVIFILHAVLINLCHFQTFERC
jgi:hypothetical protein